MKTFKCVGAWVRGCAGEKRSAPARPHARTPASFQRTTARQVCLTAFILAVLLGLAGCGYYGFSGASIPEEYSTIAIVPIEDAAAGSPFGTLDDQLTELLAERFVERTRLRLATNENDADVVLTGRLTEYRSEPAAVGDERATLNRVTINADVRYYENGGEDLLNDTYSNSEEYDPTQSGDDAERQAANAILEDIADDIFSNATSNW